MLDFVPVRFDLYRAIRPAMRWTLQCLVGFADKTGRCFPSVRKLAEVTGISKSSVSRHLSRLERDGILTRHRKPGGVYSYRVDQRFLPLSHHRERAVPRARTEENPSKYRVGGKASSRAFGASDSALLDQRSQWQARMRAWHQSEFWLPLWGPKPNEPGCFATVV